MHQLSKLIPYSYTMRKIFIISFLDGKSQAQKRFPSHTDEFVILGIAEVGTEVF